MKVTANGVAGVILAALGLWAYGSCLEEMDRPEPRAVIEVRKRERLIADLRLACEADVVRHLLTPSTARFPRPGVALRVLAPDSTRWQVQAPVDAQNLGGAPVRGTYDCLVEIRGGRFLAQQSSITFLP